ncbi:OsmC family protein [Haliea sp. E17]|uniref:OsmC family protein n=1 Tax=Haliea sp. E17 TaxID=3401576 RepID=UPI003AAA895F
MEELPHTYSVAVCASPEEPVCVTAEDVPELVVAPPKQFGGSGDQWSPEELQMSALASCFVMSFRAIAKYNELDWSKLQVAADGQLDKVERKMKFTAMTLTAQLTIGAEEDADKARRLLQKSEESCFISNSLNCEVHLDSEVISG